MVQNKTREQELLTEVARSLILVAEEVGFPWAAMSVRNALERYQAPTDEPYVPVEAVRRHKDEAKAKRDEFLALSPADLESDTIRHARTHPLACSCGCGATKPDDGRCECGQPVGHGSEESPVDLWATHE